MPYVASLVEHFTFVAGQSKKVPPDIMRKLAVNTKIVTYILIQSNCNYVFLYLTHAINCKFGRVFHIRCRTVKKVAPDIVRKLAVNAKIVTYIVIQSNYSYVVLCFFK